MRRRKKHDRTRNETPTAFQCLSVALNQQMPDITKLLGSGALPNKDQLEGVLKSFMANTGGGGLDFTKMEGLKKKIPDLLNKIPGGGGLDDLGNKIPDLLNKIPGGGGLDDLGNLIQGGLKGVTDSLPNSSMNVRELLENMGVPNAEMIPESMLGLDLGQILTELGAGAFGMDKRQKTADAIDDNDVKNKGYVHDKAETGRYRGDRTDDDDGVDVDEEGAHNMARTKAQFPQTQQAKNNMEKRIIALPGPFASKVDPSKFEGWRLGGDCAAPGERLALYLLHRLAEHDQNEKLKASRLKPKYKRLGQVLPREKYSKVEEKVSVTSKLKQKLMGDPNDPRNSQNLMSWLKDVAEEWVHMRFSNHPNAVSAVKLGSWKESNQTKDLECKTDQLHEEMSDRGPFFGTTDIEPLCSVNNPMIEAMLMSDRVALGRHTKSGNVNNVVTRRMKRKKEKIEDLTATTPVEKTTKPPEKKKKVIRGKISRGMKKARTCFKTTFKKKTQPLPLSTRIAGRRVDFDETVKLSSHIIPLDMIEFNKLKDEEVHHDPKKLRKMINKKAIARELSVSLPRMSRVKDILQRLTKNPGGLSLASLEFPANTVIRLPQYTLDMKKEQVYFIGKNNFEILHDDGAWLCHPSLIRKDKEWQCSETNKKLVLIRAEMISQALDDSTLEDEDEDEPKMIPFTGASKLINGNVSNISPDFEKAAAGKQPKSQVETEHALDFSIQAQKATWNYLYEAILSDPQLLDPGCSSALKKSTLGKLHSALTGLTGVGLPSRKAMKLHEDLVSSNGSIRDDWADQMELRSPFPIPFGSFSELQSVDHAKKSVKFAIAQTEEILRMMSPNTIGSSHLENLMRNVDVKSIEDISSYTKGKFGGCDKSSIFLEQFVDGELNCSACPHFSPLQDGFYDGGNSLTRHHPVPEFQSLLTQFKAEGEGEEEKRGDLPPLWRILADKLEIVTQLKLGETGKRNAARLIAQRFFRMACVIFLGLEGYSWRSKKQSLAFIPDKRNVFTLVEKNVGLKKKSTATDYQIQLLFSGLSSFIFSLWTVLPGFHELDIELFRRVDASHIRMESALRRRVMGIENKEAKMSPRDVFQFLVPWRRLANSFYRGSIVIEHSASNGLYMKQLHFALKRLVSAWKDKKWGLPKMKKDSRVVLRNIRWRHDAPAFKRPHFLEQKILTAEASGLTGLDYLLDNRTVVGAVLA